MKTVIRTEIIDAMNLLMDTNLKQNNQILINFAVNDFGLNEFNSKFINENTIVIECEEFVRIYELPEQQPKLVFDLFEAGLSNIMGNLKIQVKNGK